MTDDEMRVLCRNANAHNFILDLPEVYTCLITIQHILIPVF